MGIAIFESVGPRGEELAQAASATTEIPVGIDPELRSATFDADEIADGELEAIVIDALGGLDPDWRAHLRPSE